MKVKKNNEKKTKILFFFFLGNTRLKQKENDNNILFIQENTPIGTTIAHIILNDLDSFGK